MLDTQKNEWLSRLRGDAPSYASLALAALIVVELARLAISLLSGPVKSPEPVMTRAVQPHKHPGVDVQSVVSAHLFGVATVDPSTPTSSIAANRMDTPFRADPSAHGRSRQCSR